MYKIYDNKIKKFSEKLEKIKIYYEKNIKEKNKLMDEDIKTYQQCKLIYDFFIFTKNKNLEQYLFLWKYYFSKKYKLIIKEFIDTSYYKDLQIIDNLHDFYDGRIFSKNMIPKTDENINMLKTIRNIISQYLSNDIKKIILDENKEPKNVNQNSLKEIFQIYNYVDILLAKKNLKKITINKNYIYYETSGLIPITEMSCPYKKAIDKAKGNCDSVIMRNLNKTIYIDNYDGNIILFKLYDEKIFFNIYDKLKYYLIFFDATYINNFETINIGKERYIMNNSVKDIFINILNKKNEYNNKLSKNPFDQLTYDTTYKKILNCIIAGLHLKRLGDYAQIKIFNEMQMAYLQTNDRYCFLYGIYEINPYKILILGNEIVFSKYILNNKIYSLFCYNIGKKQGIAEYFKTKLLNIISNYNIGTFIKIQNKKGGYAEIKNNYPIEIDINDIFKNKIETKNENKIIDYNNIMSYKDLIEIINNIIYDDITRLCYKTDREKYEKLLGDYFPMIDELIIKLSRFADISFGKIRDLYESIASFEKYKDIFNFDEKGLYYISLSKKIYYEIPEEYFIKNELMFYYFISDIENYKINMDNNIENICKQITEQFDKYWRKKEEKEFEDEYSENNEYLKESEPYTKLLNMERDKKIMLSDEKREELIKKRDELYEKYHQSKDYEKIEENKHEQYGGENRSLGYIFKKYTKYKLKYLHNKKLLNEKI